MASIIILIIANFITSWQGFRNRPFYDRLRFDVEKVLLHQQYYRLLTGGFLHVGWGHLIWNMISLYAFSSVVVFFPGPLQFLLIYFTSIVGGNLFALFVHRHHSDYGSVGASGGVSGIIFASIALLPGMDVGFIFLPVSIPGWIFGLVYVVYSIYGIRGGSDGIGHEAHLAGGLMGMMLAIGLHPEALQQNLAIILLITIPMVLFIVFTIVRPHSLLIHNSTKARGYTTIEDRYNANKANRQKELDRILEKINRKGIKSLNSKELAMLKEYSKTVE